MSDSAAVSTPRRAFLWASAGRYLVMAINLLSALIMARLLTPADYGVSVLGGAVLAIAEAIRALGGGTYLIQKTELAPCSIRSTFTVSLIVTLALAAVLMVVSGPVTRAGGMPDLGHYLPVAALGYCTGPFVYTVMALMSRALAFGTIARIGVASAAVNASAGIGLAWLGFGYMSFAWASVASAFAALALYLAVWRDLSIFRPSLHDVRGVVGFGVYDGATALLWQIGEMVPYLILGRLLDATAVGLAQRAALLCLFPERVILAGVGAVALPAFSQQMRDGKHLKDEYLRATTLITAALWPALIVLGLLAGPVVAVLLGPQWHEVTPLVQILTASLLLSFPACLQYPVLVASGRIRLMPPIVAAQSVVSIGILTAAASHGLHAAALSMLFVVPMNGLAALLMARLAAGFRWPELARALAKSFACAVLAATGPALVVIMGNGRPLDMTLSAAILAGVLALAGWIAGLAVTRHPLLGEMAGLMGVALRKVQKGLLF
jgi:O-antigen/teichoic acid export membrane protein